MSKASDLLGKSGSGGIGNKAVPQVKVNITEHIKPDTAKKPPNQSVQGGKGLGGAGGKAPVARRPKV